MGWIPGVQLGLLEMPQRGTTFMQAMVFGGIFAGSLLYRLWKYNE